MKTPIPRLAKSIHGRILLATTAGAVIASAMLSTASATPPFPIYMPRSPAPTRVELAPPNYGTTPTHWRPWPGQAEMLAAARAERERRRAERRRKAMEAAPAPVTHDDPSGPLDLGDGLGVGDPSGLDHGLGQPGSTGIDVAPQPGMFDDAPSTLPPSTDSSLPSADDLRVPTKDSPSNDLPPPAAGVPTDEIVPGVNPPLDEGEPLNLPGPSDGSGADDAAPDSDQTGRYRRGTNMRQTVAAPSGKWRSAGTQRLSTSIPALPPRASHWSSARSTVVPAGHQSTEASPVSPEPRRIELPVNASSIRDAHQSPHSLPYNMRRSQPHSQRAAPATTKQTTSGWTTSKRSTRA